MTREPLADTRFKRPSTVTKHGFPREPRTPVEQRQPRPVVCDMSRYVLRFIDDLLLIDFTSKTCDVMACQRVIDRRKTRLALRCRRR